MDVREYGGVRFGPLLRDSRRRRVRRRGDLEQLDGLDPGLEAAGGDAANAPRSESREKVTNLTKVKISSVTFPFSGDN